MAQPHAVIIGGGVGGLTSAAALHDRGWTVTVCERAPSFAAVDVGLAIAPNGLRALDSVGLGDLLRARAVPQGRTELRRVDGRRLLRFDEADLRRRFGAEGMVVSRAALVEALLGRLPATTVHTGVTVTDVEAGDIHGLARVRTNAGELAADLVVAADGLRSAVRDALFPDHPGPVYAGFTTWRFVAPAPDRPFSHGETWGRGAAFGVLPLPGGRVYCYATANAPAGRRGADERAELLRLMGEWHDPVPSLLRSVAPRALVRADAWLLDTPLPAYHRGRIALVGDAAHAMPPNLDQGVCQAMEDAAVLAHRASSSAAYLPTALASYTDARLARTSHVVQRIAQLAELVQAESPTMSRMRDIGVRTMSLLAPRRSVSRYLGSILDWQPPARTALL
ncbi:FAD-dependent monooxygenase [Thermobifida halotolerans]|uniref:FAD-dependent monooxygenase n=1 Tax=Thermobifida halotolerans TaxID=483545 RepID=A0A399G3N4_9ACTN|nr:FAD-dependent monooxygenase [Thermobifida halotolerans]UOE18177.1 FAD-dependent monooxygenase [Thermobifida halotolerans]